MATATTLGDIMDEELEALEKLDTETLCKNRLDKYMAMGVTVEAES